MKRVFSLLIPEVPILIGAALLLDLPALRGTASGLATVFPFTVLAAALLLGWRFNRSRLVFAIALLALTEYVLLNGGAMPRERVLLLATMFLLPINLALVALLLERGTVTPAGLLRWVLLVVQVIIVGFLAQTFRREAHDKLRAMQVAATLSAWLPVRQDDIIDVARMDAL